MTTDQSLEVMLAELVREKVLRNTRDEVPHAVGVQLDDLVYDEKRDFHTVAATIYVERESQKGIIIGKGGEMIRADRYRGARGHGAAAGHRGASRPAA